MIEVQYSSQISCSAEELIQWQQQENSNKRISPPWKNAPKFDHPLDLKNQTKGRVKLFLGIKNQEWETIFQPVSTTHFVEKSSSSKQVTWKHEQKITAVSTNTCQLQNHIQLCFSSPQKYLFSKKKLQTQIKAALAFKHLLLQQDFSRKANLSEKTLHILLSGGTGLVGKAFTHLATTQGHKVTILTRTPRLPDHVFWDPTQQTLDLSSLEKIDAVVHLAGSNIASKRWSKKRQQEILSSRIDSTQLLLEKIALLSENMRPEVFVCASGISGVPADGIPYDESHPIEDTSFLGSVVAQWEKAAQQATTIGMRLVLTRLAPVLDPRGGVLAKMLPAFQWSIGGALGDPKAYFPWISIEDTSEILLRSCLNSQYQGAFHLCAPTLTTRATFAQALAKALKRPVSPPTPEFIIQLVMGKQMATETALANQNPVPLKLKELNYSFRFSTIGSSLRTLLGVL